MRPPTAEMRSPAAAMAATIATAAAMAATTATRHGEFGSKEHYGTKALPTKRVPRSVGGGCIPSPHTLQYLAMPEPQQTKNADDNSPAAHTQPIERYADLRSKARTSSARELVFGIYPEIQELEQKTGSRVRKRRVQSGARFVDALERFVGDLLRVKAGTSGPARIYRAVGKSSFKYDPVKYNMFIRGLEGLKALELVGHLKGQTRYCKSGFWPDVSVRLPGRAARFWATSKLLKLAERHAIHSGNVAGFIASL